MAKFGFSRWYFESGEYCLMVLNDSTLEEIEEIVYKYASQTTSNNSVNIAVDLPVYLFEQYDNPPKVPAILLGYIRVKRESECFSLVHMNVEKKTLISEFNVSSFYNGEYGFK